MWHGWLKCLKSGTELDMFHTLNKSSRLNYLLNILHEVSVSMALYKDRNCLYLHEDLLV